MPAVSVDKLKQVVDRGLRDTTYADRIFNDPDRIAQEHGLSDDEKLVLKQMDRKQFDAARKDAEEKARLAQTGQLSDAELDGVAGGTAINMIVGRSILGASGKSYKNLMAACDCCPWKSSVC